MKIRVKSKVVAGAISVGLLSGVGFAFANTDAGGALKSWYDGRFNSTVEAVNSDLTAYMDSKKPGLEAEYNGMKNGAETAINTKRDGEIASATGAISNAKSAHIQSVEAEKQKILNDAEEKFYFVFLEGWKEIQKAGNNAIATATSDLTAFTGEKGQAALDQITTDLTAAKETAVSELEAAIENAKNELNADLDSRHENTMYNLRNQVNWKIEEVRGKVNGILDGLVKTQEGLIVAKADELESDALAALDAVVSTINE